MFYEDQHKLAAYLERTGAAFEYITPLHDKPDPNCLWAFSAPNKKLNWYINRGYLIRPVLRYGLPSHLKPYKENPRDPGEGYRVPAIGDKARKGLEFYGLHGWTPSATSEETFKGEKLMFDYRLPATVLWPDWEREEAAQPDPKDARIAELEEANSKLSIWKDDMTTEHKKLERWFKEASADVKRLEAQLATSPWRRMSEVPTEEDADAEGCVISLDNVGVVRRVDIQRWEDDSLPACCITWMPVPKFHGWPDPLAEILKAHGVAITPELNFDLHAWKGVEK